MSEGRKVVENTLQLLILVLPEGILLEAKFEEHEQQQQSARPSKKQNRRKQSEANSKPQNNDNTKQKKALPFKASVQM
jgi:hypothetical protein